MKRFAKIAVIAIAAVAGLAVLSYFTTTVIWDGGFPAAEVRITVRDTQGRPIKGASLRVYRGSTRERAFGYPFANYVPAADLLSDESGRIVAVQERGGMQFGGITWRLFWVIPMGNDLGPRFQCEITAPGYRPVSFEVWRLFESPYSRYEQFPKTTRTINEQEAELPVYEQTFTLSQ